MKYTDNSNTAQLSSWNHSRIFVILAMCVGVCICSNGWAKENAALQVEITGVEAELLENVQLFLSIANAAKDPQTDSKTNETHAEKSTGPAIDAASVYRMHRQAPEEIRRALQPFGFYAPSVDTRLDNVDGRWRAVYQIDRGPPTLLRHIDIQVFGDGSDEPLVAETLTMLKLIPGERLDHRRYEEAKSRLSEALYNAGFIDAGYKHSEIKVYPEISKADIILILESGPQFYYGPISVEQDILHPDFVERLVNIEQGDRFDTQQLIGLQLALQDSGYFRKVEISAEREKAVGTQIPVFVETTPSKPRRYTFGLGFGTDTGPRATTGAEWRRINRRGHKMRADLRLSAIEQSISGQYLIPIKDVVSDSLAFTASASRENVGDIDTDQFKIGTSLNENWLGFRRRVYLSLERESFDVGSGSQTSDLLMPGVELSRRNSDDLIYPRTGYRITLDVHGGIESPLTETTFVHTRINARSVLPLGKASRILMRGEIGAIRAATFSELPPSQRFFTGGDQSVRGYGYQELGPQNSSGDVIGGPYLAVASLELDYLLFSNFGVAAFFDAGNAGDELLPDLKKAYGAGLRYRLPVAMIRLDIAQPMDDPGAGPRLHISIGSDL